MLINLRTYLRLQTGLVLVALLLLQVAHCADDVKGLVLLEYAGVTLGVKLNAGGRVLLLKRAGGKNVLKANPAQFTQIPPEPSVESPWIPFNGHITWIGPQEQFWTRNQLDIPQRQKKETWPPDPYISYGRFKIIKKTSDTLIIEGPASPISGVRLRKEFRIFADGRIWHRVIATNTGSRTMELNLWSNTRVDGSKLCYAPIPNRSFSVGVKLWEPYVNRELEWNIESKWFYFAAIPLSLLPECIQSRQNKIKFYPKTGAFFAIGKKDVLVKQFIPVKKKTLFAGQGAAEIYQRVSRIPEDNIAELEFYGARQTLKTGESTSIEEWWMVVPHDIADKSDNITWLNRFFTNLQNTEHSQKYSSQ